jgi:hypothetical protein
MTRIQAFVVVASLVAWPGLAVAQPTEDEWELTLTGSGSNDNDWDAGAFGATGSLGYFLTENFELLFRQTFAFANSDEESGSYGASSRVAADYHFDLGRFQPFVGANLGFAYGDEIDETAFAAPEVGAKFYVKQQTFLFALAEYQFFFDDASEADEAFDNGAFVYSIGVGFSW